MNKPCLDCGTPTPRTRCATCTRNHTRNRRGRPHYAGNYRQRAAAIRAAAHTCWLCGGGPKQEDPWQADHIFPGDPTSPLAPAHRSCNARRGNKPPPT